MPGTFALTGLLYSIVGHIMPWKSVNTAALSAIYAGSSPVTATKNRELESELPLSIASKFRVNILAAASTISNDLPKRRRPSAKINKTAKCKIEATASRLKKTSVAEGENRTSIQENPRQTTTPSGAEQLIDYKVLTPEMVKLGTNPSSISIMSELEKKEDKSIGCSSPCPDSSHTVPRGNNTAENSPDNFVELSSEGDMSFEGFDLSEGDFEALDSSMSTSTVSPEQRAAVSITSGHLAATPGNPDEQPMTPFMHPSLFHSFALGDSNQAAQRFVCFRAGELLQLVQRIQSSDSDERPDLKIQFFATVREVCFADRTGQGQGVVLADIFFSQKPPFVAAFSKTSYSIRGLLPQSQAPGAPRGLVKALLVPHSSPRSMHPGLGWSSRMTTMSNTKSTNLEVLEVCHSSWEEVRQVKVLIEEDTRVTYRGKRPGLDEHHQISHTLNLDDMAVEELTGIVNFSETEL